MSGFAERIQLTNEDRNRILDIDLKGSVAAAATYLVDSSGNQIDSFTISSTNLDIRDLTSASDSVAAVQSGTWNVGLSTGTNTIGSVQLTDGVETVTIRSLAGGLQNAMNVALVNNLGEQINTFGGGTQYTEGESDASITGTAMLMEGAGNTLVAAQGTAADGLLVNLGTNNDVVLGAGAASIGTLGANSGVDIGDVTINNAAGASAVNIQDGGNTITVDGTVAATQSGAWSITDISGTISLPTGAATAAKQDTIIGHVDGIEGILTTIDADTGTLAGAVAAGQMQVDVVAELPAGTQNIGDVDILSIIPGTGATNLGKAIDSVGGATDTGVAVLAIRDDALAALTPVEGDYVALRVNSTGALHVTGGGGGTQYVVDDAFNATSTGTVALVVRKDAAASLVGTDGDATALQVDANGKLYVNATVSGGTGSSAVDDAAFTVATDSGTVAMGLFDDVAPDSVNEGDAGALRMSANRNLYSTLRDAAGNERGANVNASNELLVAVSSIPSHAVTNAGTFVVQENGAALTALQLIDDAVYVDDADWTDSTSKHLLVGGLYQSTPQTITDGDVAPFNMTATGALHVHIASGASSGTQYTEGDTDASITGTAIMFETNAGTNTVGVVNSATPLPVTAVNAGTFAVQIDGAALTALQLIDDIAQTEDVPHGSGDKGVMALAIYKNSEGVLASQDGDYAPLLVNDLGFLRTAVGEFTKHSTTGTLGVLDAEVGYDADAAVAFQLTGTWSATVAFEASLDDTNWFPILVTPVGSTISVLTATTNGIYQVETGGFFTVRARASAYTSGTVNVKILTFHGAPARFGPNEYAEDAAHASGDKGIMALAVRKDAETALAGTDGDYTPLQTDAFGSLRVILPNDYDEDSAHTTGDPGLFALTVRKDTAASTAGTDGDYAAFTTDGTGRLWTHDPVAVALLTTIDSDTSNLPTIKTNTDFGAVVGGGTEATALRVTIASNSTGVLSVDDNGSSLTVDNGGTFVVQENGAALTALQLIDNIVQAEDAVHSTGAAGVMMLAVRQDSDGTQSSASGDYEPPQLNAAGRLKVAVDGLKNEDAGHVTGDSGYLMFGVQKATAGSMVDTNLDYAPLQFDSDGWARTVLKSTYAEDVAHTTGDLGHPALVVRKDAAATIAGTDGDYSLLQVDSTGALRVTGGGGGTEYNVDDAAPVAATGSTFVMERDDILASLTEVDGDWTNPRSTAEGALWTQDFNSDAMLALLTTIDADTSTLVGIDYMIGTDFSSVMGTASLVTADQADDLANSLDTLRVSAFGYVYDGATWDRARGDATNGMLVNLGANNDVTVTGTLTTVSTVTTVSTLSAITGLTMSNAAAQTTGDEAHDAVDAGNPVKVGGKSLAIGSNPTAVAAADRTDWYFNRHGIPYVLPGHMATTTISASYTSTQTDAAVITIGTPGKIVILGIAVMADGAGTGPLDVQVGFGAATITSTRAIIDHPGIVKGSGVSLGFAGGVVAMGGDNEDLRITAAGFGSGDELTITVSYFTIES